MVTHKEALRVAVASWFGDGFHHVPSDELEQLSTDMEAAIREYLDARGLVMVPKEPTPEMIKTQGKSRPDLAKNETTRKIAKHLNEIVRKAAVVTFKEMLAAAPDPFQEDSE